MAEHPNVALVRRGMLMEFVPDRRVTELGHRRAQFVLAAAGLGSADLVPDDVIGHEGIHDRHLLVGLGHVHVRY